MIKKSPVRPITLGGRERERRDVVAWLRNQAKKAWDDPALYRVVRELAFDIEHGAHLRKKRR